MNIDQSTTYGVAAKDLEPGMVLQLHTQDKLPAEIESVDKRDPEFVEIYLVEPHAIKGTDFTFSSLTVPSDSSLTRYHEN